MDEKSRVLFSALEVAYADPEVKKIPDLAQVIVKTGTLLDTDEDDSYQQAVTYLSRGIASYYAKMHSLPVVLNKLYHQVQADVLAVKLDDADLRKKELATGLIFIPVMFN